MRHGGGQQRVTRRVEIANQVVNDDQILAVHEALEKLAGEEPKKAELVKLRYFAGLSVEEAAELLGISEPTAKRWWAYAGAGSGGRSSCDGPMKTAASATIVLFLLILFCYPACGREFGLRKRAKRSRERPFQPP